MRRKKLSGSHAEPRFDPAHVQARRSFEDLRATPEIAAADPPESLDSKSVRRFRQKLRRFRQKLGNAWRGNDRPFEDPDLLLRGLVEAGCDEEGLIRHLAAAGAVYAFLNRIRRNKSDEWEELYGVTRRALDRLPKSLNALAKKLRKMDRSLLAGPAEWHARRAAQVIQFPMPDPNTQKRRLALLKDAGDLVEAFKSIPGLLERRALWIDQECLGRVGSRLGHHGARSRSSTAASTLRRVRLGVSAERALLDYLRQKTGTPRYRQAAELLSLVFDVAVPPKSRSGSPRERPSFDLDVFEERVKTSAMPAFSPERIHAFADRFLRRRRRA
jgi:hypothetical protein